MMNNTTNHNLKNSEIIDNRLENRLKIFESDYDNYSFDTKKILSCFHNHLSTEVIHLPVQISLNLISDIVCFFKGIENDKNNNLLIADLDNFSNEIARKIKNNTYKIGRSKQIDGNYRPFVLDEKGKIVKQITLKELHSNSMVLENMSNMILQSKLQEISNAIDEVKKDIKDFIQFARSNELETPIFLARETLKEASAPELSDEIRRLKTEKANDHLKNGLVSLYLDLEKNYTEIMNLHNKKSVKNPDIDKHIKYLIEDMNLIPKYVGLRVYLFNCLDKKSDEIRTLDEYKIQMKRFFSEKIDDKHTPANFVHMNFPYNKNNTDFWITDANNDFERLNTFDIRKQLVNKNLYQISILDEEQKNE